LKNPDSQIRWEAAKALNEIEDPGSAHALASALDDPEIDVRWMAAAALIHLGRKGVVPLLQKFIKYPSAEPLRESVYHVCKELARAGRNPALKPVVDKIEQGKPLGAAFAATDALSQLDSNPSKTK
jgi:HEAT repeat protein